MQGTDPSTEATALEKLLQSLNTHRMTTGDGMRDAQNYQTERSIAAQSHENRPAASRSNVDANNPPGEQSQSQKERPCPDSSSLSESPISEPGQRKDVAESSGLHTRDADLKINYSRLLLCYFCYHFIFRILLGLCLAGVFGIYGSLVAAMLVIVLVGFSVIWVIDAVKERLRQINRGSEVYS